MPTASLAIFSMKDLWYYMEKPCKWVDNWREKNAIQRQVCLSADVKISITFLHGKYSITFRCSYCFPEYFSRIPRCKIHDNVTNIIFPRNPIKSLVHICFSKYSHNFNIIGFFTWDWYFVIYMRECMSMSLLNSYRLNFIQCNGGERSWWKL